MKEAVRLKSGRGIGQDYPCFLVAEVGNNHQGSLDMALEMVRAAARCGADAVKFQKRHTESLLTLEGRNAPYCGANSFGKTYGEHRNALELSLEEMVEAKRLADELGLIFFASAWDSLSLREMADLGVEVVKFSSADLVCIPLLRQAGAMGVPVILSTGMSTLPEIDGAVNEILKFHDDIVVLHCNSTYPCPEEHIALPVIEQLRRRYKLPVGYSGHERGLGPSVAAAALGACVIERHFTLDRNLPGTDHQASLEPADFGRMAEMVREVEKAMQTREKQVFPSEVASAKKLRKSIIFARDLPSGHVLTEADLMVKCPGTGVSPVYWDDVVGAVLKAMVHFEEPLSWDHVTPSSRSFKVAASVRARRAFERI